MKKSVSIIPAPSRAPDKQLWMVPYARNAFFSGRAEELQAMVALLHDEQSSTNGLALSGAGGSGKTQLALEYAYLQRKNYRYVFWALAETRETLHAAYSDIAELLALPERRQTEQRRIVEAVTGWLATHTDWLLILDSVDEPALLKQVLPATFSGHILITTRTNGLGKLARRLRIKPLAPDEGGRLVLRRSGLWHGTPESAPSAKDDEAARAIAEQLDALPLALHIAGAYLAATSCGLPGYLERLHAVRLARPRAGAEPAGQLSEGLLKAVHLSGAKAARADSPAADLLTFCALLAPDEIPVHLLLACQLERQKHARKRATPVAKIKTALNELQTYALLEHDGEMQFFSLAREVQAAWKAQLAAGAEKAWAEYVVRALGTIFATLDVNDWEACQRLLPHAQVCAEQIERWQLEQVEGAWLLHHMGWYLHTRGQYAEAQRYEERALAIYRLSVGPDHPSTAMLLNNLAITYEDQGKLNDAAALHAQALALRRKILGEEHPETAASLNSLALVYHDQGKLDEAAPLYRQALAIRTQILGADHPEVATMLSDLASLYTEQGKFDDALALYQKALTIRRKTLGSRHPETVVLFSHLARAYQGQGKLSEAIHWCQQALAAQRKRLGAEHPAVATTLRDLASIYQAQGKLDEAAFWLQHSLAILYRVPEQELLAPTRVLETLAIAYEQQEQYEKAEALYCQALILYRRIPENSQLDLARCSYNLASLYHDRKRDIEARPLLEQALAIWQEQRGPNHPDTRKAHDKYEQLTPRPGKNK